MTEEQQRNKEYDIVFKARVKQNIALYNTLTKKDKRGMIVKTLSDYEDCPEKRKYLKRSVG